MAIITFDGQKFLTLSWEDIEELVDRLYLKLSSSYAPDVIIGIMRGGMIVANLLSDLYQTQEVYAVGCRSYIGTSRKEVRIYHNLVLDNLSGRSVLLVDDVSDTGNTLTTAVDHVLQPRRPEEIKTATLHIKPWTSNIPDFYVEKTDAWIIYPWERMESVRILGAKMLEKMGFEDAVREISRITRVKEKEVRKTLDTLKANVV